MVLSRRFFTWLFVVVWVCSMGYIGCDSPGDASSPPKDDEATATSSNESPESLERDDTGAATSSESNEPRLTTSETLPDRPKRIVSLAPNITETLFALGLGDRAVGVTKFCNYPEEVDSIPSVGSFTNPDFEAILAREPDLVIGPIAGGDPSTVEKLEKAGVAHAFLRIETIDDVLWGIDKIGAWTGATERADKLTGSIENEMQSVAEQYEGQQAERVLMIYGHDPLVGAGSGTFGHQLLDRLGATNVLADLDSQHPRLDLEKVLELDPTHILDTTMSPNAPSPTDFWSQHDTITAVERDRVAHVTNDAVLRPGPRLPEAMRVLGEALYGNGDSKSDNATSGSGEGFPR